MACQQIGNAIVCGLPDKQTFICLEHTTYLMEFTRMFGPFWFRMPDETPVFPEPDGHLSFLWDFFDDWYKPEMAKEVEV